MPLKDQMIDSSIPFLTNCKEKKNAFIIKQMISGQREHDFVLIIQWYVNQIMTSYIPWEQEKCML